VLLKPPESDVVAAADRDPAATDHWIRRGAYTLPGMDQAAPTERGAAGPL